jgi:hypothetical protein
MPLDAQGEHDHFPEECRRYSVFCSEMSPEITLNSMLNGRG